MTTIWYHKTQDEMTVIRPFIHLGTAAQANMRAAGHGANVIPMEVRVPHHKLKRMRDTGSWDEKKLKALQRKGYQGVIYLNRFEGIPYEEFEAARTRVRDIDKLPDSRFKQIMPSAEESIIVFDPRDVTPKLAPTRLPESHATHLNDPEPSPGPRP